MAVHLLKQNKISINDRHMSGRGRVLLVELSYFLHFYIHFLLDVILWPCYQLGETTGFLCNSSLSSFPFIPSKSISWIEQVSKRKRAKTQHIFYSFTLEKKEKIKENTSGLPTLILEVSCHQGSEGIEVPTMGIRSYLS